MVVRSALSAERPCGAFASKLNRLPTISERSNVRVASIHTLMSTFAQKQVSGRAIKMSALGHKRTFAPQNAMSALHPKADMCSATRYVRLVPIADIAPLHSITSSALASSFCGTARLSALAVLRLIARSYLVGACTGRSAGFSPLRMRST